MMGLGREVGDDLFWTFFGKNVGRHTIKQCSISLFPMTLGTMK